LIDIWIGGKIQTGFLGISRHSASPRGWHMSPRLASVIDCRQRYFLTTC